MASSPVIGQAPIVAHLEPAEKIDNGVTVESVMVQYEYMKLANVEDSGERSFIWPEGTRPDMTHDEYDFELPVIDLSPVLKLHGLRRDIKQLEGDTGARSRLEAEIKGWEAAKLNVAKAIRAACEEYGFFQIINTGIPMEVVDEFRESCRQVFDLPLEKKTEINKYCKLVHPAYLAMKRNNGFYKRCPSYFWNEVFMLASPETTEQLANILWQGESESSLKGHLLKSRTEEFRKHSSSVVFLLLDLMVNSLEIPEEAVSSLLGDRQKQQVTATLKVTNYPICEHPELTWGLGGHTDGDVITLLHQDEVGGLQIRFKDGTWHGVRPKPGAFVINCGDYLQAWTNGRFLSVEHRVVTNEKCRRMSVAYFARNPDNYVVSPRPECVDAEHPIRYKPFTKEEHTKALLSLGIGGDVLDRAFGIPT